MNSRERVKAALAHKAPDRIPLDIGATDSSGMTGIAYARLKAALGLGGAPRIYDPYQQLSLIEPAILDALEIDAVSLNWEPRTWKRSTLPDGSACEVPGLWNEKFLPDGSREVRGDGGSLLARMPAEGFYFEWCDAPLRSLTSASQVDPAAPCIVNFDVPGFSDETWEERAARARRLHATGRAVVGNLACHLLAAGEALRGYENFMCDLVAEKALAHALLDALCAAYMRRADRYVKTLGPYLDVILVNDDLGTQNGPIISLSTYREMIRPYQKRFFGHLRQVFDGVLLLHSCGAIAEFLPDLIECGVQAINPVQISAAGMDPAQLKREFGKDIVFWGGGCDTQRTLNRASAAQVGREVRRNAAIFGAHGGFVFTQVHNIQPDVPAENVLAMVRALRAI
ncbi:MAG: uroporphyrinogen decarboxylase family protein [Candidatus Brocadiia bacterium]|jgi:uroporphyrinogen decarboxylase